MVGLIVNEHQKKKLVIHLPSGQLKNNMANAHDFYRKLHRQFITLGGEVEVILHERLTTLLTVEEDKNFHIIDHGSIWHPRILQTGIAFVYPFWNCDPKGIRSNSSIGKKKFTPSDIDADDADRFVKRLKKEWVETRSSRYSQPVEKVDNIPEKCIAIFLQSEGHRSVDEISFLDRTQMVESVINCDLDYPIVIKKHPRDKSSETDKFVEKYVKLDNRVTGTTANIHDILEKASVCVTINSAVGIEGYMHQVPLILCGKADFAHRAEYVRQSEAMAGALEKSFSKKVPFSKYLYWYFGLQCLNARSNNLAEKVINRIAQTGYDIDSFGLKN